jgi:hypothetical protein
MGNKDGRQLGKFQIFRFTESSVIKGNTGSVRLKETRGSMELMSMTSASAFSPLLRSRSPSHIYTVGLIKSQRSE